MRRRCCASRNARAPLPPAAVRPFRQALHAGGRRADAGALRAGEPLARAAAAAGRPPAAVLRAVEASGGSDAHNCSAGVRRAPPLLLLQERPLDTSARVLLLQNIMLQNLGRERDVPALAMRCLTEAGGCSAQGGCQWGCCP
jgi:hypothetical protein